MHYQIHSNQSSKKPIPKVNFEKLSQNSDLKGQRKQEFFDCYYYYNKSNHVADSLNKLSHVAETSNNPPRQSAGSKTGQSVCPLPNNNNKIDSQRAQVKTIQSQELLESTLKESLGSEQKAVRMKKNKSALSFQQQ